MKEAIKLTLLFLLSVVTISWVDGGNAGAEDVEVVANAISNDQAKLISGRSDGVIEVISLFDQTIITSLQTGEPIADILINPTSGNIFVSTTSGNLFSFDIDSYTQLKKTYTGIGYARDIEWLDPSVGTRMIAVGANQDTPTAYVYNTTMDQVQQYELDDLQDGSTLDQVAVKADGNQFTVSTSSTPDNGSFPVLATYSVEDGSTISTYDTPSSEGQPIFIEYDDSDNLVALVNNSNTFTTYDTQNGNSLEEVTLPDGQVGTAMTTDLDNKVVIGTTDGITPRGLIYQKDPVSGNYIIEDSLETNGKINDIAIGPNNQIAIFAQTQNGNKIYEEAPEVGDSETDYTAALTTTTAAVFVGSVGVLAGTSAAQGATLTANAAAGTDAVLATAKNMI